MAFFAASHEKSLCDGIGGTVKSLAAPTSLQVITTDHIWTAEQLFLWADSNILGIKFFHVPNTDVMLLKADQEARYKNAKKVPRTRNHHWLIPVSQNQLMLQMLSYVVCCLLDFSHSTQWNSRKVRCCCVWPWYVFKHSGARLFNYGYIDKGFVPMAQKERWLLGANRTFAMSSPCAINNHNRMALSTGK